MGQHDDKPSLFRRIKVPDYVIVRAPSEVEKEHAENIRRHLDLSYRLNRDPRDYRFGKNAKRKARDDNEEEQAVA